MNNKYITTIDFKEFELLNNDRNILDDGLLLDNIDEIVYHDSIEFATIQHMFKMHQDHLINDMDINNSIITNEGFYTDEENLFLGYPMDISFIEADDYINNSRTYYYQNIKMKHEKFFKQLELERELSTLRNKRDAIDNEISLLEEALEQLKSTTTMIPKPQLNKLQNRIPKKPSF